MRILIIEDEKHLAETLADILNNSGYNTDIANNGIDGLEMARSGIYDGIVLDVMLPGMDGYEILQNLRNARLLTPVLMLTARSELADRVHGLDSGADYYLTKPFENEELLACLRTVLRKQVSALPDAFFYGDLVLTPSTGTLCCGDRQVTLSARETELLRLLIQNSNQFLPKENIFLKVWGYDCNTNPNSVEAYMSFLRRKLTLLGSAVRICAARSIGYKLEEGT
ncbi:MAG: response regulator transcription factor [Enterocloster asparagiformis]|nr:response regulator transcription factor [Enterocloster asparagiformis]